MSNSSNTPGWLTPLGAEPAYDAALDALLAGWIAGVSALAQEAIVAQAQVLSGLPEVENSCTFAVTEIGRDLNPAFTKQGNESASLRRGETLSCCLTFRGPQGQQLAARFLDGVLVSQNQAQLQALGFTFGGHEALKCVFETINNQPAKRYDVTLRLFRTVVREYGVMPLTQAPVIFFTGE